MSRPVAGPWTGGPPGMAAVAAGAASRSRGAQARPSSRGRQRLCGNTCQHLEELPMARQCQALPAEGGPDARPAEPTGSSAVAPPVPAGGAPARHDRLAGRVAARVVVVAALRTGLRIIARPGTRIHRIDRLATGQGVPGDQAAHALGLDLAFRQRRVQAAPSASIRPLRAWMHQRWHQPTGDRGVQQLEQRVPRGPKQP